MLVSMVKANRNSLDIYSFKTKCQKIRTSTINHLISNNNWMLQDNCVGHIMPVSTTTNCVSYALFRIQTYVWVPVTYERKNTLAEISVWKIWLKIATIPFSPWSVLETPIYACYSLERNRMVSALVGRAASHSSINKKIVKYQPAARFLQLGHTSQK